MSQRTHDLKNRYFNINLNFRVNLIEFSNHNGFNEAQIENAIIEFKENIESHLANKLVGTYQQDGFLQTVDFVGYEVD